MPTKTTTKTQNNTHNVQLSKMSHTKKKRSNKSSMHNFQGIQNKRALKISHITAAMCTQSKKNIITKIHYNILSSACPHYYTSQACYNACKLKITSNWLFSFFSFKVNIYNKLIKQYYFVKRMKNQK